MAASQAAQACFGSEEWPSERPVPQASIEFEVEDADAVQAGAEELRRDGFALLHDARTEPWADGRPAAVGRGRDRGDLLRARIARVT